VEATSTNLDGAPIDDRRWDSLGRRRRLATWFLVALFVDLALHAPVLVESVQARGFSATSWRLPFLAVAICALLTPVVIVARTPDVWSARRSLLIGGLLIVAAELVSAAREGVLPIGWWLLGYDPSALNGLDLITSLQSFAEVLVGIAASLSIAFALVRTRTRPLAPSRGFALAVLLVLFAVGHLVHLLIQLHGAGGPVPAIWTLVLGLATVANFVQAAVILNGWLASGWPARAWRLAAAGTLVSLIVLTLGSALRLAGTPIDDPFAFLLWSGLAIPAVLMLVAFAEGLGASPVAAAEP